MGLRGWLAHLLLTVFVLRALVPAGYMPDFSGAAQGVFKVVICSAAGAKTLNVDADGHEVPQKSAPSHDQPCAFGGLAKFSLPELTATAVEPPSFSAQPSFNRLAHLRPPVRAGPAVGSRAPPLSS